MTSSIRRSIVHLLSGLAALGVAGGASTTHAQTALTEDQILGAGLAYSGSSAGPGAAISGDTAVVAKFEGVFVFGRDPTTGLWVVQGALLPSVGNFGSDFSLAISEDGDRIVVANAGRLLIFSRGGGGAWVEAADVAVPEVLSHASFGASVAVSGDVVVVGSPRSLNPGTAYVYEPGLVSGGGGLEVWQLVATLHGGTSSADRFGDSVAASGDRIVVGAPRQNRLNGLGDTGAAYIFERNSGVGTWDSGTELLATNIGNTANQDDFGNSVAIRGDTVVVGALNDDYGDSNTGSASIYRHDSGAWSFIQRISAPDGAVNDRFGIKVALNEGANAVVVGAQNVNSVGSAYVFRPFGSPSARWAMACKVRPSINEVLLFGSCLDISGNDVLAVALDNTDDVSPTFVGFVFNETPPLLDVIGEDQELFALDGVGTPNPDSFGQSVGMSGDTLVVGAPSDDFSSTIADAGSAYVYLGGAGTWGQPQKLIASDRAVQDFFGSAVAISDDVLVIGSRLDDNVRGANAGGAYIYRRDSIGVWSQEAKLIASDGAAGDQFGSSVAISGEVIVVGAPMDDNSALTDTGSVYVFRKTATGWDTGTKVLAANRAASDGFGSSVALNNVSLVVGAPFSDRALAVNSGSAYLIQSNGTSWVAVQEFIALDSAQSNHFGSSVGINHNDEVIVGAPGAGASPLFGAGAAYIYRSIGGTWVEHRVTAFDAAQGDSFGTSVSIGTDATVISAPGNDDLGPGSGAAYVFRWNGTSWLEDIKLLPSDGATFDTFGSSVAIDGDVVVGANSADGLATDTGSVYVYERLGNAHNTPAGTGVSVDPIDPTTGTTPATITFDNVSSAGDTTVVSGPTGPPPPPNFQLVGLPPIFYEIATTAAYSGQIQICIDYSNLGLIPAQEAALTLQHFEAGSWVPIAPPGSGSGGTICGFVTSLSPFALLVPSNHAPIANCGGAITIEATSPDGAVVQLDGSASFDPDGDVLAFHWDAGDTIALVDANSAVTSGVFPIGVTTATLTVIDGNGSLEFCTVEVSVQDNTPTQVVCTSDSPVLWPPNHTLRNVRLIVTTSDVATNPEDIIFLSLNIRSDEADDAAGDGDGSTTLDVNGSDGFASALNVLPLLTFDPAIGDAGAWVANIQLRAERDGGSDGRCYTVDVIAIDAGLNMAQTTCCIVVPHGQGKY